LQSGDYIHFNGRDSHFAEGAWGIVRVYDKEVPDLQKLPEEALRQKTAAWKEELSKIEDKEELARRLGEILPEAFAVVKNACRRLCGSEIIVRPQGSTSHSGYRLK